MLFNVLLEKAKQEGVNIKTGVLTRNSAGMGFYEELSFKPLCTGLLLDLQKGMFDK